MCLSIVSRLGGELKLASTEFSGACFEVTLQTETGADESASGRSDVTPLTVPLRLLLVDDEDALLRAARRRLKPHDVVGVSSGAAALSLLAQDSSFDAVMCDVMMSGMSGVEVYESLKERLPEYARRFVFMTGGSVSLEIEQWLEEADLPLVDKPLRRDVVFEALAGIVARTAGAGSAT